MPGGYVRAQRLSLILVLSILGCGDDAEGDPSQPRDAQARDDASARDASLDAASFDAASFDANPLGDAQTDATTVASCTGTQIRCRNACFQNSGDKFNGCEMVFGAKDDLRSLELFDGALYAYSADGPTQRRVMRIQIGNALGEFGIEKVATLPDLLGGEQVKIQDGFVYYADDGAQPPGIYRASLAGGPPQFVVARRPNFFFKLHIHGGYLYQFGELDVTKPLQRTPVAGGTTEELGGYYNVDSLAVDATHYYVHREFPGPGFYRIAQADVTSIDKVPDTSAGFGTVLLWPQDPTHVYFHVAREYGRFDKSTLEVTNVATTDIVTTRGKQAGDHYWLHESYSAGGKTVNRTVGLRWDGQVDVLDDESDGDVTEDARYYYLVREGALFRIAR
jgi:hypothetical protein